DNNGYVDDVYGFNFGDHNSDPMDVGNLAGSAVAGVIGAVSDNGKGIAGINWSVRLMALRLMISDGTFTWAAVTEALKYVAMMKERGVNIRVAYVGAVADLSGFDEDQHETLKKLDNLGVLVVAFPFPLADNDKSPGYPACYPVPNIITVTGLEQNGLLTSRAGWGKTNVDLAAPAGNIPTADGSGPRLYWVAAQGGQFYLGAAHVAGAAALLAAAWPDATAPQIKAALLESVDLVPALTNKVATHGRLNAGRAMDHLTTVMTGPRSLPQLGIARSGSGAILTWPTSVASVVLEQSSTLLPQGWAPVSGPRETNGLSITINVSIADRAFFRLRQP
ncbi:MAG: S8 family serine peptidase, partial [Verrucomicrobiales bacterium]|nr:S8 family serine peptidase [Verrucomicrobiales bacterium]